MSLTIEVKVSCGFMERGLSKNNFITLELEVSHGLFRDIFNHAKKLMQKMAKVTLTLPSTRYYYALLKEYS